MLAGPRAAWHMAGGSIVLFACASSTPTTSSTGGPKSEAECEPQAGVACEDVLPGAPPLELDGQICGHLGYDLSVCWLDGDVDAACRALFPEQDVPTCPLFREFVVATGWVSGGQSDIAQATVSRCSSVDSSRLYEKYWWSEVAPSATSGQALYANVAHFDVDTGRMVSLQRYQINRSRAVYPEIFCCNGSDVSGVVTGALVVANCDTEVSTEYQPSDFR